VDPDIITNIVDARKQTFIPKRQKKDEGPRVYSQFDKEVPSVFTEREVDEFISNLKQNTSANLKFKGGQPVNSTNPILALIYGAIVRFMSFFFRNATNPRFTILAGDEQNDQVAEDVCMKFWQEGKPLLANDVTQMDASHTPITYKFFSCLFSGYMQRVFGVDFDFMPIFEHASYHWSTHSQLFTMGAEACMYLSSGIPWTFMLNCVAVILYSFAMVPIEKVIFFLAAGDDSLMQLLDVSTVTTDLVEKFGVKVKPIITYEYAEFLHKIFSKEGSAMIVTRKAMKLLSHNTPSSKHAQHEFSEYFQGWKEDVAHDLSVERFPLTLALNVRYHGFMMFDDIEYLMHTLNIVYHTEAKRLFRGLVSIQQLYL
jgi:hypothetical protein